MGGAQHLQLDLQQLFPGGGAQLDAPLLDGLDLAVVLEVEGGDTDLLLRIEDAENSRTVRWAMSSIWNL
ncbi:MAG: hypothetical protein IPH16_07150 [Haliscomenobacter sp.]|nr:hypothetical protein [Haliscomenobacter sp.]